MVDYNMVSGNLPYVIFYLPDQCRTTDGEACKLPFVYQGKSYDTCTNTGENYHWCSTNVDFRGEHVRGDYGKCATECPIEEGIFYMFSYLRKKTFRTRLISSLYVCPFECY